MRIVVYCYITNNINHKPWPEIKFRNKDVDYVMFTDDVKPGEVERNGWKLIKIPTETQDMLKEDLNKFYKWHPYDNFKDYDYSLYMDSKVCLLKSPYDIVLELMNEMPYGFCCHKYDFFPKRYPEYRYNYEDTYKHIDYLLGVGVGNLSNLKSWKSELLSQGFPKSSGVLETAIVLTDLHNPIGKEIQDEIFDVYKKVNTTRDQVVIPYILWKRNLNMDSFSIMGNYSLSPYGKNNSASNINNRDYSDARYGHTSKTIVSMTSWVKRIGNVKKIVESIMNNTKQPDILYLNLSKTEFEGINLPKDLVDYFNSDSRLVINWVDGENTKSMKKIFPILQYLDDDDIIITADDDILFPRDLIESRLNDFYTNGKQYAITSNRSRTISLPNMYVASAVSLYQKKMLNNWDRYVDDTILKTYNDDRTYLYILWLNGYLNKPCSKYEVRELLKTYDLELKETSMTTNKIHIAGSNYDKIAYKRLKAMCDTYIENMFGYFNERKTVMKSVEKSKIQKLRDDIATGKVVKTYIGNSFIWKRVK